MFTDALTEVLRTPVRHLQQEGRQLAYLHQPMFDHLPHYLAVARIAPNLAEDADHEKHHIPDKIFKGFSSDSRYVLDCGEQEPILSMVYLSGYSNRGLTAASLTFTNGDLRRFTLRPDGHCDEDYIRTSGMRFSIGRTSPKGWDQKAAEAEFTRLDQYIQGIRLFHCR